jgi:hypothetical protein
MPSIKPIKPESSIDARFPGYQQKEHLDEGGVHAYILQQEHVTENYPCYNYGYYIGDDISHDFHAQLLVVPAENTDDAELGWVIVRVDGHTLISERNDSHSVSVSCELASGEHFDIEDKYFYEKYGGQSHDIKSPLDAVLHYFQGLLGYVDLTLETLASWFSTVRSRFSY